MSSLRPPHPAPRRCPEYDGGDCCSCTCDPENSIYYTVSNADLIACTEASFDCKDTSASCYGEVFFPDDDDESMSMSMSFESMSYEYVDWGVVW